MSAFKQTGIKALNGIFSLFKLKPALESLRKSVDGSIASNQATIAKIDAVSAEYHSAGRHIKNIGLAIRGKEPVAEIKPNGKLSKLIKAPFRSELRRLTKSKQIVAKMVDSLERLEKTVPRRDTATVEAGDDKPSVREAIKNHSEQTKQNKKEVPTADRPKHTGTEL